MRFFLFLLAAAPLWAWAQNTSVIEFTIANYRGKNVPMAFRLELDDFDSRKDKLLALAANGFWDPVFRGPITSIQVPGDTTVHQPSGNRANLDKVVRIGDYSLEKLVSPGLRIESGEDFVLMTYDGPVRFKDVGRISELIVLDASDDMLAQYVIVSFNGIKGGATHMLVEDMVKNPVPIAPRFIIKPLGAEIIDGDIVIPSLNIKVEPAEMRKAITALEIGLVKIEKEKTIPLPVSLRAAKHSADEVLNLMMEQLDSREFAEIGDELRVKVEQTIKAFMLREFPALRSLQIEDRTIKLNVDRVAADLSLLWMNEKLNGTKIKNVLFRRLSTGQAKRAECELGLMNVKGPMGYHQGTALRALNLLYKKMLKAK